MPIHSDSPAADLSRLRIDRDSAPRRRRLPWQVETARAVLLVPRAAGGAPDLPVLSPLRELDYYANQSRAMTTAIRVFGTFVTRILSIDAMCGAMNTMYAAVAYRTREIGTLRALGFSELRIVTAFMAESIVLALVGGLIGCILALPVHGLSTGITNFASFSEVAFKFRITPALPAGGLLFAGVMGAAGGLLPAIRAARIPVARALREI